MATARYVVGLEIIPNINARHLERRENFHGSGPAGGVGQVVVTHQQEGGNAGCRQSVEALGELALVGLGWITAFVDVTGQQHQVYVLGQGVLDYLI